MTELAWHSVGAAEEAPVGFLRRVEVEGAAVCLGKTADGWVAFQDTCTHEDCSLSDGELEGGVIVCPCHASEFDLRTGDVLCPPALEPLPIFEARVEAGRAAGAARPAAGRRRGRARAGGPRPDRRRARRDAPRPPRSRASSLDDIDLTDLGVWEQGVPYEWLTLLRREAPLHWQPEEDGRGFWVFTRYDDIVQMSKDWETYSSEIGRHLAGGPDAGGGRGAQVDARHRPAGAHAAARARQQGLHAARRQHLRGADPRRSRAGSSRRRSSATRSTGSRTSPRRSRCGSSPRSWGCRSTTGAC